MNQRRWASNNFQRIYTLHSAPFCKVAVLVTGHVQGDCGGISRAVLHGKIAIRFHAQAEAVLYVVNSRPNCWARRERQEAREAKASRDAEQSMRWRRALAYEVVGAMGSGDKNGKRRRSDYAQTTTVTFRHSLLATCYSPLATRYLLLATCYLLPATCLLLHPAG